jgi:hypothetical protein
MVERFGRLSDTAEDQRALVTRVAKAVDTMPPITPLGAAPPAATLEHGRSVTGLASLFLDGSFARRPSVPVSHERSDRALMRYSIGNETGRNGPMVAPPSHGFFATIAGFGQPSHAPAHSNGR